MQGEACHVHWTRRRWQLPSGRSPFEVVEAGDASKDMGHNGQALPQCPPALRSQQRAQGHTEVTRGTLNCKFSQWQGCNESPDPQVRALPTSPHCLFFAPRFVGGGTTPVLRCCRPYRESRAGWQQGFMGALLSPEGATLKPGLGASGPGGVRIAGPEQP